MKEQETEAKVDEQKRIALYSHLEEQKLQQRAMQLAHVDQNISQNMEKFKPVIRQQQQKELDQRRWIADNEQEYMMKLQAKEAIQNQIRLQNL